MTLVDLERVLGIMFKVTKRGMGILVPLRIYTQRTDR